MNNFPKPPTNNTSALIELQELSAIPQRGHAVALYGPGGIGKTTLTSFLPAPIAMFDFDNSLPVLRPRLEELGTAKNVRPVYADTWEKMLQFLDSPGWDNVKTIVIDSATKAEELCIEWTLANVPHEKGNKVTSIEGYGYGKGFTHVYETFLKLLVALDSHCRAGRNVVLICHDCVTNVPNPAGDDWIRYEPRLQSPNSGKASIRLRVRDWADHMLFYGYDVVAKDGKGKGSGTATIYTTEFPHCMAKSRTSAYPIPVDANAIGNVWSQIIK